MANPPTTDAAAAGYSASAPGAPGYTAGAEFFLNNYRLGKTLGIGSFGKVRKRMYTYLISVVAQLLGAGSSPLRNEQGKPLGFALSSSAALHRENTTHNKGCIWTAWPWSFPVRNAWATGLAQLGRNFPGARGTLVRAIRCHGGLVG